MKKTVLAMSLALLLPGAAIAEDVKLGVLIGFTGPIESLAPAIAAGAEFAMEEVNGGGKFMGGSTVTPVRGDSTCADSAAATAAAERLITSDGVAGIVGADCSGVTSAVLQNVALPNGIVMISPSATSPGLSTAEDNGLFFRTAPSDARQGEVMADLLLEQGDKSVAVAYINNDYGNGLLDSFVGSYTDKGGEITHSVAYESGKGDYTAEVAALSASGGDVLVLIGYIDQGGSTIIRNALDLGAYDRFHLVDGMISDQIGSNFGTELNGSTGQAAGTDSPGNATFQELVGGAFEAGNPYSAEAYDAAALIMMAMQSAGSTKSSDYKDHVMKVANAPGEEIFPGELSKALEIIAGGGDVNYVGATAVELIGAGESAGSFASYEVKGGSLEIVGYR